MGIDNESSSSSSSSSGSGSDAEDKSKSKSAAEDAPPAAPAAASSSDSSDHDGKAAEPAADAAPAADDDDAADDAADDGGEKKRKHRRKKGDRSGKSGRRRRPKGGSAAAAAAAAADADEAAPKKEGKEEASDESSDSDAKPPLGESDSDNDGSDAPEAGAGAMSLSRSRRGGGGEGSEEENEWELPVRVRLQRALALENGFIRNAIESAEKNPLPPRPPKSEMPVHITDVWRWAKKGKHEKLDEADPDALVLACQELDPSGESLVLYMVSNSWVENQVDVLQVLLERGNAGQNINDVTNYQGRTPLHLAVENGNNEIVLLLLEHGADPTIRDNKGKTPLHLLCHKLSFPSSEDCEDSANALVRAGADPNETTDDGKNCVFLLVEAMCKALTFNKSQSAVESVNRSKLHTAFNVLSVLCGERKAPTKEKPADAAEAVAEGEGDDAGKKDKDKEKDNEPTELDLWVTYSNYAHINNPPLDRMAKRKWTPLSMLVRIIIVLQRAMIAAEKDLVPSPDDELAFKNLLRTARLIIDKSPEDKNETVLLERFEGSGSVLDAIVRNEIRMLVVHPKVQKLLNEQWKPNVMKNPYYSGESWESRYQQISEWGYPEDITTIKAFRLQLTSRRCQFICSALFYMFWLAIMSAVFLRTYMGNGRDEFMLTEDLRERFVGDELPFDADDNPFMQSFGDMATQDNVNFWLKGPFGDSATSTFNFDGRVGKTRLRMFRYQLDNPDCFAPSFPEDTKAYSPEFVATPAAANAANKTKLSCVPRWTVDNSLKDIPDPIIGINYQEPNPEHGFIEGFMDVVYPSSGGYVIEIDPEGLNTIPFSACANQSFCPCANMTGGDTIECLVNSGWVNQGSAVLIAEEAVYNPGLRRFAMLRMVVEFPISGVVKPWHRTETTYFVYQTNTADYITTIVMEVIVVMIWALNFVREIRQLTEDFWEYIRDRWNWNDLIVLFSFLCLLVLRVIQVVYSRNISDIEFNSLWNLANYQIAERVLASIVITFVWAGVLKFVRFYPDIGILLRIIKKEVRDIAVFLFIYIAMLLGFSLAFHLLLGTDVMEFSDLGNSLVVTALASTADYDYEAVSGSRRAVAIIFFFVFLVFSAILLLNLLIAMLSESYARVLSSAELEYLCERASLIASYVADESWELQEDDSKYEKIERQKELARQNLMRDLQACMKVYAEGREATPVPSESEEEDKNVGRTSRNSVDMDEMMQEQEERKPHPAALKAEKKEGKFRFTLFDFDDMMDDKGSGVLHHLGAGSKKQKFTITASPMAQGKPEDFITDVYATLKEKALAQRKKDKAAKRAAKGDGADKSKKKKKKNSDDEDMGSDDMDDEMDDDYSSPDDELPYDWFDESNVKQEDLQPRTQSIPDAKVQVDLGKGNRLVLTQYRMKWTTPNYSDKLGGAYFPRNWVMQGTNSDAAANDPTSTALDKRWVNLTIHVDESYLSMYEDDYFYPKSNYRNPKGGVCAFRYFRVIMTGRNAMQDWVDSLWLDNDDMDVIREAYAPIHTKLDYILSFNAFELYGALFQGGTDEFWADKTYIVAGTEGGGDTKEDDDDEDDWHREESIWFPRKKYYDQSKKKEAAAMARRKAVDREMRAQKEAEQKRLHAALGDENKALAKFISNTTNHQLALVRSHVDMRLAAVSSKLRTLESAVEFIQGHTDVEDYDFVYSASDQ